MKKFLFKIFITFFFASSFAQNNFVVSNIPENLQLGISAKGIIEFQKWTPNFRIGLSAGCGYIAFNNLYPTVNIEYSASFGGYGTFYDGTKKKFSSNLVFAGTVTAGTNNEFRNNNISFIQNRNQPLYYFTDLIQPSLQNPFNCSVSVGTNWVYFINTNIHHKWQRVGFFDFKFDNFQFGYFNDGGAIVKHLRLGDREDRYYTGGGFVNINLPLNRDIDNINLSFYRFTGFTPYAFDIANEFLFAYVDYKDADQNYLNSGFWNFGMGNNGEWNGFVRANNVNNLSEVQNLIHYLTKASYHQNQKPFYWSFGGGYNLSNLNISGDE